MPLLPSSQFLKFSLWHTHFKHLHTSHDLSYTLALIDFVVRRSNQPLDTGQALCVQMSAAQLIIDLVQHLLKEPVTITLILPLEHLVHKPTMHEPLTIDLARHQQRLVGHAQPHPLHQANARASFRDQTQRRERREQIRVRRRVDEIAKPEQRRAQADSRTVERCDEDLRVLVETARNVEVVTYKAGEDVAAFGVGIGGGAGGSRAGSGHVGASGEEAAYACEDGDCYLGLEGNFAQ